MKPGRLAGVAIAAVLALAGCSGEAGEPRQAAGAVTRWKSGDQVRVEGRVVRILADDRDGSPHQRFVIEVDRGATLLVAHNLDLAPRLEGLSVGEQVVVFGQYEWNERGGTLHWTHDDPQGRHPAGYVEWRGRRYQ